MINTLNLSNYEILCMKFLLVILSISSAVNASISVSNGFGMEIPFTVGIAAAVWCMTFDALFPKKKKA